MRIVRTKTLRQLRELADRVSYNCPFCTAQMPVWKCNNCGWQPVGIPRRSNRA